MMPLKRGVVRCLEVLRLRERALEPIGEPPFAHSAEMSASEIRQRVEDLDQKGIRLLPFPFARCISIVNDHDHTERADYEAYRDLLVGRLGLDFRDSFYLYHDTDHSRISPASWTDYATFPAVAWYAHDGRADPSADSMRDPVRSLSFFEVLREAHRGNLDHIHGLSWFGTRLFPLRGGTVTHGDGASATLTFPVPSDLAHERVPPEWLFLADEMPVLAVVVQLDEESSNKPDGVTLVGTDGLALQAKYGRQEIGDAWKLRFDEATGEVALFVWRDDSGQPPPNVSDLSQVKISYPFGVRPTTSSVVLASMHRSEILRLFEQLSSRFEFPVSLLVDHAGRTFLNVDGERGTRALVDSRMFQEPRCSVYGLLKRKDAYFSTLADDTEAVNYVLPDLVRDFGVRYVNPGHVSGELCSEFSIFNVVVPTTARDGTGLYLARRTFPPLPSALADEQRLAQDAGTRSIPHRLSALLAFDCQDLGSSSPVYTHISVTCCRSATVKVPTTNRECSRSSRNGFSTSRERRQRRNGCGSALRRSSTNTRGFCGGCLPMFPVPMTERSAYGAGSMTFSIIGCLYRRASSMESPSMWTIAIPRRFFSRTKR